MGLSVRSQTNSHVPLQVKYPSCCHSLKIGRSGMPRSRYNGGNPCNGLLSIPQECILINRKPLYIWIQQRQKSHGLFANYY